MNEGYRFPHVVEEDEHPRVSQGESCNKVYSLRWNYTPGIAFNCATTGMSLRTLCSRECLSFEPDVSGGR